MKITNNMTKKEVLFGELKIGDVFTNGGERVYMRTEPMFEAHTENLRNIICLNNGVIYYAESNQRVVKVDTELIIR